MSHHVRGRQFIFEEEIVIGLLMVMAAGMVIGLFLGLVIGLAGIFFFEMMLSALALFILYDAYDLTFLKKSGAQDTTGFGLMVMFCTLLVLLFMAGMRYSAVKWSTQSRCAVFSIIGVTLALVAYVYARLCCQEDERKHHLGPCSPGGDELMELASFGAASAAGVEPEDGAEAGKTRKSWRNLRKFLLWILRGQFVFEVNDWLVPPEEDCNQKDRITVYNRSLKLIKVVLYSSYDMVCWVPVGGIAGSCVGFVRSGEKRTLTLPRPWRRAMDETEQSFRLKVFMPGLLDKESLVLLLLASYSKARRGQCFAFTDVEGMVRRSRLLSSETPAPHGAAANGLSLPIESSEEEYAACASAMAKDQKFGSLNGAILRRRSSAQLHQILPQDGAQGGGSPSTGTSCRKAAPDEIVVRNRSSEDVRALLFRADDYCYLIPAVGKLMACGDCILQGEERRFNPLGELQEYTLKVYSVGPASKELTYLTVRRGNAYTFCDSLLS